MAAADPMEKDNPISRLLIGNALIVRYRSNRQRALVSVRWGMLGGCKSNQFAYLADSWSPVRGGERGYGRYWIMAWDICVVELPVYCRSGFEMFDVGA